MIRSLIERFLEPAARELDSLDEIRYAHKIIEEGNSATRQLGVFEKTGSLPAVMDHLIAETALGIPLNQADKNKK